MTENDIVFKFYEEGERPDPNCFCHYGWEGQGSFAFWKYACAYYDSAEALFQIFFTVKGRFRHTGWNWTDYLLLVSALC